MVLIPVDKTLYGMLHLQILMSKGGIWNAKTVYFVYCFVANSYVLCLRAPH